MRFVCYSNWDELHTSVNTLFGQAEKDSIFYSRPWFERLSSTLSDDQELLLACIIAGTQVMAVLPLIKYPHNNFQSLKHRYSPHYSFLIATENQQQILTCLAQGLLRLPLRSLLLEPITKDDTRISALHSIMTSSGYRCEHIFRSYNWVLHVQGQSFKDYMAGRPSRLRNTIARKKRKLDREHGYKIHLYNGEQVPQAMVEYYDVFTASWKANEQYVDFLNGIVASFSRPGWTRLAVLHVEGKPIAAQLWFVLRGKASIFRLAYDEAWKPYSPGSILTAYLMEYVIDTDKVEEIDFLTGNDTYKQDWMSARKEHFALSCVKNIETTGRFIKILKKSCYLKRMFK